MRRGENEKPGKLQLHLWLRRSGEAKYKGMPPMHSGGSWSWKEDAVQLNTVRTGIGVMSSALGLFLSKERRCGR